MRFLKNCNLKKTIAIYTYDNETQNKNVAAILANNAPASMNYYFKDNTYETKFERVEKYVVNTTENKNSVYIFTAESTTIKNLAEKFDVFVQYLGESFSFDSFGSSTSIHVVRQEDNQVLSDSYIFTANDKYTPEGARYRLLDKIRSEQPIDKSTYKLGK